MNRKLIFSVAFMLFSPAISLFQGLLSTNRTYKQWLLIAFITFYGSVIMLAPGSDGFQHLQNVELYYVDVSFADFSIDFFRILTFQSQDFRGITPDLYKHFLSYFVGGILGMPKLFFVFVSFIYGFFYSKSLFKLIKLSPKYKYNWVVYSFLTLFVLWKGLEGINTVRTWTGLWVLFYASISYYQTKKLKYLILMFLPPYIHVGYFIMAIPAYIVLIAGVRPKVYSIIFFLSFSVQIINPQSVTETLETTEVGQSKVKGYYVEEEQSVGDKIDLAQSRGSVWYKVYAKSGLQNYAINVIALFIIIAGYFDKKMTYVESSLFSIGILTQALSSSTWFLFALQNRSAIIAGLFLLAAIILMIQRNAFNLKEGPFALVEKYIFMGAIIFMTPYIIIRISELAEFISVFMLSTPFVIWLFGDVNISIKTAFKSLIGV